MIEFQGFPKIPRYSRECIITEKIDGTNVQIFWDEAMQYVLAGSRNRWVTTSNDNHGFARWVSDNVEELKKLGPGRHFGEWYGHGINRGYGLKEKRFSLFNTKRWEDDTIRPSCCYITPILYKGILCESAIETCLKSLEIYGSYAVPGYMNPEGIVIYHVQGNILFKKTIKNDDEPKSKICQNA